MVAAPVILVGVGWGCIPKHPPPMPDIPLCPSLPQTLLPPWHLALSSDPLDLVICFAPKSYLLSARPWQKQSLSFPSSCPHPLYSSEPLTYDRHPDVRRTTPHTFLTVSHLISILALQSEQYRP